MEGHDEPLSERQALPECGLDGTAASPIGSVSITR
jgi:hypothetical protein